MTGQGLYAHYSAAYGGSRCAVDPWELLDEGDRAVWEDIARRIHRATGRIDLQLSALLTESIINDAMDLQLQVGRSKLLDNVLINIRALRSLLLLKETQNENAVYRGMNEGPL